ncbi:MAG TPA: hypothetical protein VMV92_15915 [Streptosporangiaceae bacterium]|nr:hypothetical protein [Streptosporangiaceae bacterium]
MAGSDGAPDAVIDRVRGNLQARIAHTRDRIDGTPPPEPGGLTERELRRDLIGAENAELARLYENGTISAAAHQRLQRGLDLEATRLSDEQH